MTNKPTTADCIELIKDMKERDLDEGVNPDAWVMPVYDAAIAQLIAAQELAKALHNFNLGTESPFSENMKYEFADNALQDWRGAGGQ